MSEIPIAAAVGLGMLCLPLLVVLLWLLAEAYHDIGGWRGVLVVSYPLVAGGLMLWGVFR